MSLAPARSGRLAALAALSLGTLLLSACASPGTGGSEGAKSGSAPVKVGLVYSRTGPLADY
ncbi:amino acid ABC transporter substrate-binding protein, partial [Streptomyces sp. SID11233]|nr:amino acid ABC transporter substrate-binding protein [Streptomyces sp. SID11233]